MHVEQTVFDLSKLDTWYIMGSVRWADNRSGTFFWTRYLDAAHSSVLYSLSEEAQRVSFEIVDSSNSSRCPLSSTYNFILPSHICTLRYAPSPYLPASKGLFDEDIEVTWGRFLTDIRSKAIVLLGTIKLTSSRSSSIGRPSLLQRCRLTALPFFSWLSPMRERTLWEKISSSSQKMFIRSAS